MPCGCKAWLRAEGLVGGCEREDKSLVDFLSLNYVFKFGMCFNGIVMAVVRLLI